MRRLLAALLLTFALAAPAAAADCWGNVAGTQANCGSVQMFNNASGQSQPVTAAAPLPVTTTSAPAAGAVTSTAITVTNASGAFACPTPTKYLLIKNESTTASIALNFAAGTAVLNTAGNITLGPGSWIAFESSLVPTGAITGISSAATSPATCLSS